MLDLVDIIVMIRKKKDVFTSTNHFFSVQTYEIK